MQIPKNITDLILSAPVLHDQINFIEKHVVTTTNSQELVQCCLQPQLLAETRPTLVAPKVIVSDDGTGLTKQIMVTLLQGQQAVQSGKFIDKFQSTNNVDTLLRQLTIIQSNFQKLSEDYRTVVNEVGQATGALSIATRDYKDALVLQQAAKTRYANLTESLSHLSEDDPSYSYLFLQKQSSNEALNLANIKVQNTRDIYIASAESADAKVAKAVELATQIHQAERNSVVQTNLMCVANSAQNKNSMSLMILYIMTLLKDIGDSNEESIRGQSKLLESMNQERLDEFTRTAEKCAAKQKTLSITSKCVSFAVGIFTGVMVIVGIVAAIPTGGISVGSVIGLAAAVGAGIIFLVDVICQITLDFSPTSFCVSLIAKIATQVVDKTLGELIDKILIEANVDAETAQKVRDSVSLIAGVVVATTVVIGLTILCSAGVSGVTKLLSSTGKGVVKGVEKAASKVVVKEINHIAKEVGQIAEKICGEVEIILEKAVNGLNKAIKSVQDNRSLIRNIMRALDSLFVSTGGIECGFLNHDVIELMADMGVTQQEIQMITSIRENMINSVQSVDKTIATLTETMVDVLQERTQTLSQGLTKCV